MLSTSPAKKAPRIVSSPTRAASAVSPTSSKTLSRIRICAVESCRASITPRVRVDRRATTTPQPEGHDDHGEGEQQDQPRGRAPLGAEQHGQQHDGADVSDAASDDDRLAECSPGLAGVPEDRHDEAERRRGQRDRHQGRGLHPALPGKGQRGKRGEDEGQRVAADGQLDLPPVGPARVDLQPREEEQDSQPEQPDDEHRLVRLHPAEHGRTDDDASGDLEDRRRQPEPREEAEDQRSSRTEQADDEERIEGQCRHAGSSRCRAAATQGSGHRHPRRLSSVDRPSWSRRSSTCHPPKQADD
jgi:hypothetical protein